ncbi:hypothetical protein BGX28_010131 [Mortierella sp. GBA30]|nr:hypothetical protein BGX28_010131 [Mortierella sp. GBA30]
MMIRHQRFQLGGRVEEIETVSNATTGKHYVLLRDVQDVFPTAARFESDGRPVRFHSDEQGHRIEPWRISCFPESTLQVIPARQPMIVTNNKDPSNTSPPFSQQLNNPNPTLLTAAFPPSEEDRRDYLLQKSVRTLILVLVLAATLLTNHGISGWLWHSNPYTMVAYFWKVATITLFLLSVVWFLMLVALFVELVWFLIRTPIATKRSIIFSALHGIRVSMAYRLAIEQAAERSLKHGTEVKPTRTPWGQALLSVLAMSLGGGFTTSMLLGMPPSWLGSNVVVPTYALSFFLIQYTSLYDVLKDKVPPALLDSVLIVADGSLRALSIAKLGVDGSRMRFAADSHRPDAGVVSEPWFAMLLLGMVSGSGGGMWADLLNLKAHNWALSTPSFVHSATYDMKAALLSAFFYAASTSSQFYQVLRGESDMGVAGVGLLETQDAKAMTMLVLCTLMLGQRAEGTLLRLTGIKGGLSNWVGSLPAKKATTSERSTRASKKKRDDSDELEAKVLRKVDQDDEARFQPLRRRGRHAEEPTEDEEEQQEDPTRKSSRGRKKSTSKKSGSPPPSAPSTSDAPLTRSTRLRKPTRQDL